MLIFIYLDVFIFMYIVPGGSIIEPSFYRQGVKTKRGSVTSLETCPSPTVNKWSRELNPINLGLECALLTISLEFARARGQVL